MSNFLSQEIRITIAMPLTFNAEFANHGESASRSQPRPDKLNRWRSGLHSAKVGDTSCVRADDI
jgi:hypothetical protein